MSTKTAEKCAMICLILHHEDREKYTGVWRSHGGAQAFMAAIDICKEFELDYEDLSEKAIAIAKHKLNVAK